PAAPRSCHRRSAGNRTAGGPKALDGIARYERHDVSTRASRGGGGRGRCAARRRSRLRDQPGHRRAAARARLGGRRDRDRRAAILPDAPSAGCDYVVDPELSAYVARVGQRVAAVSERALPYEFVVLNSSVPNAWALPGGKIAVNRGLL